MARRAEAIFLLSEQNEVHDSAPARLCQSHLLLQRFRVFLPAFVTGLIRVQPYSSLCVSIARSIKVRLLPGLTFTSDC